MRPKQPYPGQLPCCGWLASSKPEKVAFLLKVETPAAGLGLGKLARFCPLLHVYLPAYF